MKFAAISDIHGNLPALEAVLADIGAQGVDIIVNLGDIVSGPLWPAETADRLMPMRLPTLAGNHERQLLTQAPARMSATDRHTTTQLRPEHRGWLASLPPTLAWRDNVFLCHGTPTSDLQYFLETVTTGYEAKHSAGIRSATLDEVEARLGGVLQGVAQGLVLCGHTHLPRAVQVPDSRVIVNTGSVGLPAYDDIHPHPHVVESGSPHARYALLSHNAGGWHADLRQVAYDFELAAIQAERHGRPDWADALRTGRVGRLESEITGL